MGLRNVLYINNSADIYGASRCLVRILKGLDRERFFPLVVLPENGPLKKEIESLGVEVVTHPGLSAITRHTFHSWRVVPFLLGIPFSVFFLWRLMRRKRIDIVHTNTGVMISPAFAAKLAGVRHIWHIRDWFQEFRAIWKPYAKYIKWSSERVIAISTAVAKQFPDDTKITVINDGFSRAEFAVHDPELGRKFRERWGLGTDFVVGCVGRIKFVRKGQEVLVKAAALLQAKGCPAKYLIVGTTAAGNERHLTELKKLISELELQDRVILTGELMDPRPAYAAMDVFVLPSAQPEPFGLVVTEALAMGVPVIATNMGGPVDQVTDGVTGFLVPPSDPQALAEKLELLYHDRLLLARMAETAPQQVAERFSVEQMMEKIHRIYEATP